MFSKKNHKKNRFVANRSLRLEKMESRALLAGLVGNLAQLSAPVSDTPSMLAPTISPIQQQNLLKLKTDLMAIRDASQVTPAQIDQLKLDLVTLAQGTTRPSEESVAKLRTDLQSSLGDGTLTSREKALLAIDFNAVLASANIPKSEIDAVLSDISSIVESSGISKSSLQTIQSDVQAIKIEFRNQHPNG